MPQGPASKWLRQALAGWTAGQSDPDQTDGVGEKGCLTTGAKND